MLPFNLATEDVRPLAEEDQQLLLGLARRYGVASILCALTGQASSRASSLSATTLLSGTSAPSLAWTTSSDASQCRSDAASIRTQSTWPETVNDVSSMREPSLHDPAEFGKPAPERTWLDSPAINGSPLPGQDMSLVSPKPVAPTNKKYQCPMCFQDNNPVGFGRKSDFKKHLHNFHGVDVVWICRTKNCHLSYATERAYSTHAKEAHRMDALPNSAARTELCPQLVFSCGFADCKDRIFEAQDREESSASRDKYFEHIAKHFEDGFDVSNWEYHIQIHNLMRQHKVKPVWKNCIWPKEKRQGLMWKPRSSGDLRRMLECRHLGDDISMLVRLAFILGTAPFTTSNTPPPSEIDLHFQLPFRSQCLMDTDAPANDGSSIKSEGNSGPEGMKRRASIPQAMLAVLPNRRSKRETRPSTPVNDTPMKDTTMRDDFAAGPHPGTPMVIPNESYVPNDAPTFVPETVPVPPLPKQNTMHVEPEQQPQYEETQPEPTYVYTMTEGDPHNTWVGVPMVADHMPSHEQQYYQDAAPIDIDEYYNYPLSSSQASTMRPATPVPNKRPASWKSVMSMETMRPKKKTTPFDQPCPDEEIPPSLMYGNGGPTSAPMQMVVDDGYDASYDLPMRANHEMAMQQQQQQQQHHHHSSFPSISHLPPQMQLNSPTTFFFDDEGRF